jgi:hypothetical protein
MVSGVQPACPNDVRGIVASTAKLFAASPGREITTDDERKLWASYWYLVVQLTPWPPQVHLFWSGVWSRDGTYVMASTEPVRPKPTRLAIRSHNPHRGRACDRVDHPCGINATSAISFSADELGDHLVVDGDAVPGNAGAPACSSQCIAGRADGRDPTDNPGDLLRCGRVLRCMSVTGQLSELAAVADGGHFDAPARPTTIARRRSGEFPRNRRCVLDIASISCSINRPSLAGR